MIVELMVVVCLIAFIIFQSEMAPSGDISPSSCTTRRWRRRCARSALSFLWTVHFGEMFVIIGFKCYFNFWNRVFNSLEMRYFLSV